MSCLIMLLWPSASGVLWHQRLPLGFTKLCSGTLESSQTAPFLKISLSLGAPLAERDRKPMSNWFRQESWLI